MLLIENYLKDDERIYLKNLILDEIAANTCKNVARYQSYNDMHKVYQNDTVLMNLIGKINSDILSITNNLLILESCWFNLCKHDSNFVMHNHMGKAKSVIYYVEGCDHNGTEFKINNCVLKLTNVRDNSVLFFNSELEHSIPTWNGVNRITVALDFIKPVSSTKKTIKSQGVYNGFL